MFRVTIKGLFQHKIRFLLTTVAVVAGVAFVVGAFTLTDSVRAQFNQLFADINANIDLTVRAQERFDPGAFGTRQPIPDSLAPQIAAVPGVAEVDGAVSGLPALVIDAKGNAVQPTGGPPLGVNWTGTQRLSQATLDQGRPPAAADEVAFDKALLKKSGYTLGDTVTIQTPKGNSQYTLVGSFTFGKSNSLAGATVVGFTTATAQQLFNLEGKFNEIRVAVEPGQDLESVRQAVAQVLPPGVEVVDTQKVVVSEDQKALSGIINIFGTILLVFAFISLFVAAFLIFNTFLIVVGQRIREMALLRAIGASARQVALSVLGEALIVGLVASVIGFVGGIVVAVLLNAVLSAAGFGGGNVSLVLSGRSVLAAFAVGIGATLLSALLPAVWATRIPPVAAMREGFRLSLGSVRTLGGIGTGLVVVGGAAIAWSLGTKPDTVVLFSALGAGALMLFIGVALLSAALASPVAHAIGLPFRRLYKTTGELARQNAAREPSRTAFTAAALMIGLALVSMSFVVGSSLRSSFAKSLGTSVTADWYVTTSNFFGFTPEVATQMKQSGLFSAVTSDRQGRMKVGDSIKQFTAVDYSVADQLFNLDISQGGITADRGLLIGKDPAKELGINAGDTVTVTFQEGGDVQLPVLAVFDNTSILGNWVIDQNTYNDNFADQTDLLVAGKSAPGVDQAEVRATLERIAEPYPQLKVQDRQEFTKSQQDQLNQLLVVIFVFLLLTIIIAFIGIVNTLALSVFERTRELGLLRAVGMSRVQVRRMVRVEAVIVSVFGALLGAVVGLVIGVALAVAIPDNIISTIDVPVGSLVIMVIVAGLFGVIAALYPAWRAGRLNVLDAIATE